MTTQITFIYRGALAGIWLNLLTLVWYAQAQPSSALDHRANSAHPGSAQVPAAAKATETVDAKTIVDRSAAVSEADWRAAPDYENDERDVTPQGSKTYFVRLLYGSPYNELVAIDGRPLSKDEQDQEKRKLLRVTKQRQHESPDKRAERIGRYEKERRQDRRLLQEFTKAFDFKLLAEEQMDGHQVYALEAIPRAGYRPPDVESAVLTGMRGKLWIDKETFQWVKVEAEVTRPVSIEGFLAKVEPGTRFDWKKCPWMAASGYLSISRCAPEQPS